MSKSVTHEDLQKIEYYNKVLKEHQEIVKSTVSDIQRILDGHLNLMQTYVSSMIDVQIKFTKAVHEIVRSSRELKVATSGSSELINYANSIAKLDEVLNSGILK